MGFGEAHHLEGLVQGEEVRSISILPLATARREHGECGAKMAKSSHRGEGERNHGKSPVEQFAAELNQLLKKQVEVLQTPSARAATDTELYLIGKRAFIGNAIDWPAPSPNTAASPYTVEPRMLCTVSRLADGSRAKDWKADISYRSSTIYLPRAINLSRFSSSLPILCEIANAKESLQNQGGTMEICFSQTC